jgi:hypothetical protein
MSPLKYLNQLGLLQPVANFLANFLNSPWEPFRNLAGDFMQSRRNNETEGQRICIAGLPKSGTTLVEEILRFNGYLDLAHTSIRRSPCLGLDGPGNQLPSNLFSFCHDNDKVFIKSHINASSWNLEFIAHKKIELIVIIRDLRDMMISRYFHIVTFPRHGLDAALVGLPLEEGLFRSMMEPLGGVVPLEYFVGWIEGWLRTAPDRVIRYEQFQADAEKFIDLILRRLAAKKSIRENLQHIQEHNANLKSRTLRQNLGLRSRQKSTLRTAGPRGWRAFFPPTLKEEFKRIAQACLIRSGYETDANW